MEKLYICIPADSLRRTACGSIDGILFFQVKGLVFPAEGWWDFPPYLLQDWIQLLTSYALGSTDCIQMRFRDGPYWIGLTRTDSGSEAAFFKGSACVSRFDLDLPFFVRQFMRACSAVTSHFPDPKDKDLSTILDRMPMLRKALDHIRNS